MYREVTLNVTSLRRYININESFAVLWLRQESRMRTDHVTRRQKRRWLHVIMTLSVLHRREVFLPLTYETLLYYY
jgi:hypothetical protein